MFMACRPRYQLPIIRRLFSGTATTTAPAATSITRHNFSSPNDKDVNHFSSILNHEVGSVIYDGENDGDNDNNESSLLDGYNIDWRKQYKGRSKLVLKPRSTEQVSRILQYCAQHYLPVVPQGGKTGLVGGSVPVQDEVILSLERMNQIYHVDSVSGIVYCQAGCILQDLQETAAASGSSSTGGAAGLLLPIDLGAKGTCQIGGNLATNAGGQYYYRHGSLAANVVGLQVVLPNAQGQIMNLNFSCNDPNNPSAFHSNLKDNTGYKLHQLFLGSEGTLGIITGVAIKCPAYPSSRQAAFLACRDFDSVVKVIAAAKQELGEILAAVEWMDQACLRAVSDYNYNNGNQQSKLPVVMADNNNNNNNNSTPYPHSILLETQGSCEEHDVEKLDRFLTKMMMPSDSSSSSSDDGSSIIQDGVLAQDLSQVQEFWNIRESTNLAVSSLGYGYKYDLSLPVTKFEEFGQTIQAHVQQEFGNNDDALLLCTNWGHVLDGNLHLNFTTPGKFELDPKVLECLEPFVFDQIQALGGSISAEHGIGQSKRNYLTRVHDPATVQTMRALKHVFDPAGILNPSKVLPSSSA